MLLHHQIDFHWDNENTLPLRIIDVRLMRATGKLLLQNGLETRKNEKLVLREDLTAE